MKILSSKYGRLILVSIVLLLGAFSYYFLKGSELKFHSVWTEQERTQIGEIANSLDKLTDYIEGFSFQNVVTTLKDDANFSEKCGAVMDQIRKGREKREMELRLYDVIYQTAKSGDASYVGEYDWTLLQLACVFGKKELIVKLLDLGADPNLRSWVPRPGGGGLMLGDNALSWMIAGGLIFEGQRSDYYSLKDKLFLLDVFAGHGADFNGDSPAGVPMWQFACVLRGQEAISLKMMELGADLTSSMKTHAGDMLSPLVFPVTCGYPAVVRKILEEGVDPNEAYGKVPFLLSLVSEAMTEESYQIAIHLLNYGADANAVMGVLHSRDKGEVGRTPLIHLCEHLSSGSAEELERKKTLIGLLIEKGADVNKAADDGTTALMFVCRHLIRGGAVDPVIAEIARMLLNKGADPKLKDGKGNTAVDYMKEGTPEQMELLPELEKKS